MAKDHRIAVVGGGISGLAAAYTLARAREGGADIDEFLIDASPCLGGVIRTEHVDGFIIEGGPDSFLTEKPETAALCGELGLGGSLLGSNDDVRRTYILHRDRLVPLPEGLQLFIPNPFWPILATPFLSLPSKLYVLSEWFQPRPNQGSDDSVAEFVRRRFGSEMAESTADPLQAGMF